MSLENITDFIIAYVQDNATEDVSVSPETEFADSGLLDSFAILNLIMTLEAEYGIKFSPEELSDPAIRTIAPLAELTASKGE